mgnify:CR=1 FL=1
MKTSCCSTHCTTILQGPVHRTGALGLWVLALRLGSGAATARGDTTAAPFPRRKPIAGSAFPASLPLPPATDDCACPEFDRSHQTQEKQPPAAASRKLSDAVSGASKDIKQNLITLLTNVEYHVYAHMLLTLIGMIIILAAVCCTRGDPLHQAPEWTPGGNVPFHEYVTEVRFG